MEIFFNRKIKKYKKCELAEKIEFVSVFLLSLDDPFDGESDDFGCCFSSVGSDINKYIARSAVWKEKRRTSVGCKRQILFTMGKLNLSENSFEFSIFLNRTCYL